MGVWVYSARAFYGGGPNSPVVVCLFGVWDLEWFRERIKSINAKDVIIETGCRVVVETEFSVGDVDAVIPLVSNLVVRYCGYADPVDVVYNIDKYVSGFSHVLIRAVVTYIPDDIDSFLELINSGVSHSYVISSFDVFRCIERGIRDRLRLVYSEGDVKCYEGPGVTVYFNRRGRVFSACFPDFLLEAVRAGYNYAVVDVIVKSDKLVSGLEKVVFS